MAVEGLLAASSGRTLLGDGDSNGEDRSTTVARRPSPRRLETPLLGSTRAG